MLKGLLIPTLALAPFMLTFACGGSSAGGLDDNHDGLPDDLGKFVDVNNDGVADSIDINHDGRPDGPGVDRDGDGKADALPSIPTATGVSTRSTPTATACPICKPAERK